MMKSICGVLLTSAVLLAAAGAAAQNKPENPLEVYSAPDDFTDRRELGDQQSDFEYTPGAASSRSGEAARVNAASQQRSEAPVSAAKMTGAKIGHHDHSLSSEEFQKQAIAAQNGDAHAAIVIGDAYRDGNGTGKDEQKALEWYKHAAQKGEAGAYSRIGDLYRDNGAAQEQAGGLSGLTQRLKNAVSGNSNPVEKDNAQAAQWYQKGVDAKDSRSFTQLGIMYRDGVGVPKNIAKANEVYNAGMILRADEQKAYWDKESARERKSAERSETVASPQGQATAQSGNGVTIDGVKCGIAPSSTRAANFIAIYDANCPGLTAANTKQKVVNELQDLTCQVQYAGDTATHRLFCSSTKPDIVISGAGCRLQAVTAPQGYAAAYDATCTGTPATDVKGVAHLGMNCDVTQGGGQQSYRLLCRATNTTQTRSIKLGKHNCALQPVTPPSATYNVYYEAYCGGLTDEQKKADDVQKTLMIGKNSCALTPWPANPQNKDFEIGCI